jgi:hypothetical protein
VVERREKTDQCFVLRKNKEVGKAYLTLGYVSSGSIHKEREGLVEFLLLVSLTPELI